MSALRSMLAFQDDAALIGAASVGLLRRARAGLGKSGAIEAVEETGDTAVLNVETHRVELSKEGPEKSRCACSATGMCRHILMAILHLRETSPLAETGSGARQQIAALTLDEIKAFAGKDWPQVLRAAALPLESPLEESDSSCVVRIADAPGPVTFVAGGGLKNALFKGPPGRRKRFVAAAALVLGGHDLPDLGQVPAPQVAQEVLDQAQGAIAEALRHGLAGDPHLAQDRLFDVAVSARVDAAPRLAAHLRSASRHAAFLAVRSPNGDPVAYLAMLAECDALVRALRRAPEDPRLTGQLRRDYATARPRDLAVLAVGKWSTAAGARGLTIYGWDGADFLSSGPARAAGADPSFSPARAYVQAFWPGLPPSELGGKTVSLPAPKLSVDGVLPEKTEAKLRGPIILDDMPFHNDWRVLRADIAARCGLGLRGTGRPTPALIQVSKVCALRFDQIAQQDVIEVQDRSGRDLTLILPNAVCGQVLFETQNKAARLLIEAVPFSDGIGFRLLSVLFGDPCQVWNVTLEGPPNMLTDVGLIGQMRQKLRGHMAFAKPAAPPNRVAACAAAVLQAISDNVSVALDPSRRAQLCTRAEVLGLESVAQGLKGLTQDDTGAALDLAWRLVVIRRAAQRL